MDSHQIKQHLTDLVLNGREEVAIEELLAMSSSRNREIRNTIAALSSRFQKFERDKTRGSLNRENIHTTSGRISQALMAIIEQVTEDDEGDLQTVDLEALFNDIDALSADQKMSGARSKSARTTKRILLILPVFVVLIVGILAFNGTFSTSTNPGPAALNSWIGEWHHEMESSGNSKVTGRLSFEIIDNNEFIGKAHNVFPDGSETTNTLSQIQFLNNGKAIAGIWKADDIQSLHGTFRFNLDGEEQFDGQYTVVNQEGEYYWNGTK